MISEKDATLQYLEARKAIINATNPTAFLRLGILYAQGIGTRENHVLANYFYEKALAKGCQEAETYIDQEFKSGRRTVENEVMKAMSLTANPSPEKMTYLKKLLEKERLKKNFGCLSRIREHLPLFYPDYNQEQGYDDLLNHRDTTAADICYALCTADNWSEVNIDVLENMLQQLYAPVTQDADLYQQVIDNGNICLLEESEQELLQCIINLRSSYDAICDNFNVEKQEISQVDDKDMFPYFKVSLIPLLRLQAFRCVLSIRDIDPIITEFLNNLGSDEEALNVCEIVRNQDIQLFLISFVEFNIDTDTILIDHQQSLRSYRDHDLRPLVHRLNNFVRKITDAGIEHQLPDYTPDNLPPISPTSSI